jgi:hypothetical protein
MGTLSLERFRTTVAEIDGQFYPIHAYYDEDGSLSHSTYMDWSLSIPLARDPHPTHGTASFPTRDQASDFGRRYDEEPRLQVEWGKLALRCEYHTERNAWYREELEKLGSDRSTIYPCLADVQALFCLQDGTLVTISAPSVDEAYMMLYEAACQCLTMKESA